MNNEAPPERNRVDLFPSVTCGESRPYKPSPCVDGCGVIVACENAICWYCDFLRWQRRHQKR